MAPLLLQGFDPDVKPCQRDIVIKVERIGDLLIDMLACRCDLLVALLAGLRDPPAEIIKFCGSSGDPASAKRSRRA